MTLKRWVENDQQSVKKSLTRSTELQGTRLHNDKWQQPSIAVYKLSSLKEIFQYT